MPKLTLAFKAQVLAVRHLKNGRALIGRDADCAIQIDSLAVAPRHVELTIVGEYCRIQALDPEYPTYVNESVVENAPLVHGDVLRVGKHTLTFATDSIAFGLHPEEEPNAGQGDPLIEQHEEDRKEKEAYIQVLSGEHIGRIIPLTPNMVRLGKAGRDCAMISHRTDGYYLSYLEGDMVTIDGMPIGDESVLLSNGSVVQIGVTKFQFYR